MCIFIIRLDVFGVDVASDFACPTSTSSSRAAKRYVYFLMSSMCLASAWRPILRASNLPLRFGLPIVTQILIIGLDVVDVGVVSHLACIKRTSSARAAKHVHASFDFGSTRLVLVWRLTLRTSRVPLHPGPRTLCALSISGLDMFCVGM
jgi:hypothetical protein